MRKAFIGLAAAAVLGLAACSSGNQGQALEGAQQANLTLHYEQVQPLPYFQYSQYRQTLTEIEAIQALVQVFGGKAL